MAYLDKMIIDAVKSGEILLGSKQALVATKSGKAVALIVASNCPTRILAKAKHHSYIARIPLFKYPDSSLNLGATCGKPFAVSTLAIREINDPEILRVMHESSDESMTKTDNNST